MEDKENNNTVEGANESESNGSGDSAVLPADESSELPLQVIDGEGNGEDATVKKLRAEAEENYDKYLRAMAELENYKKRAVKERADLMKYSGENLARDILEVVDTLQLALKHEGTGTLEEFMKGVRMVHDNLIATLERHQIRGEDSVGETFDPQKHEAMATVPAGDRPSGTVVEQFKKPYFFKDKLLRPGQVIVSQ